MTRTWYRWLFTAISVILLSGFTLFPLTQGRNARAEDTWWDTNWSQRIPVKIHENSGATLTNYQVKVTVPYSSLMQTDFDDIRFTTATGTLLSYWCETFTASTSATFWVKVPALAASADTGIYMYFGNASAPKADDIHTTFIWGDDFENSTWTLNNIYQWNAPGGDSQQGIADGYYRLWGSFIPDPLNPPTGTPNLSEPIAEIVTSQGLGTYPFNRTLKVFPHSFVIDTMVKTMSENATGTPVGGAFVCPGYDTVSDKYEGVLFFEYSSANLNKVVEDAWSSSDNASTWIDTDTPKYLGYTAVKDTWYKLTTVLIDEGAGVNRLKVYVGDQLYVNASESSELYNYPGIGFLGYDYNDAFDIGYDNFRVREYAAAEPTVLVGPLVTSAAATAVTNNSVTLNGSLVYKGSGGNASVFFEYWVGATYGYTTPQVMTSTGSFSANVIGLTAGTPYSFRARVTDGTDGSTLMFTTLTPPSVAASAATQVVFESARLNGNLTSFGTNTQANVCFEYWTLGDPPTATTWQNKTSLGVFYADVTGLLPGTTYYFRAKADGGTNGSSVSDNLSFTTTTATPPSISTEDATAVTNNSVQLNGNLTVKSTATYDYVYFEYWTGSNPHVTTNSQQMSTTGTFGTALSGLLPNTVYNFRAIVDAGVHGSATGTTKQFTTKTPPTVTTSPASNIEYQSAKLNGNLTSLGTATSVNTYFQYGLTTSYGLTASANQGQTTTGSFSANLTVLAPGTLYHFRAVADGGIHGITYGSDQQFNTPGNHPSVSTANATAISYNSATLNGTLLLGDASTAAVYFQYGTTTGYGNTTTIQTITTDGSFTASINGLNASTTYHFRAVAFGILMGEDISFTTSQAPSNGGGSIGGGGGGGSPTIPGYTSLSVYTNSDGLFNLMARIVSEDQNAWVVFDKGTMAKTKNGTALKEMAILKSTSILNAPDDWQIIGNVYDLLPEGATFSPSINFTLTYNPALVPEGLNLKNLVLMYWDKTANKWIQVPESIFDNTSHSVSTLLSHFSTYAIMIRTKAAGYSVSDLVVSPLELNPGNQVTVQATVNNTGDFSGTFNLTLGVDGQHIDTKEVTVAGGSSGSVEFKINPQTPGKHIISLGDLESTINVIKLPTPAKFETSNLQISNNEVKVGETVTVSAVIANSGEVEGTTKAVLTVNGSNKETKELKISGGQSQTASFSITTSEAGTYNIGLNGLSGSFTVTKPASNSLTIWLIVGVCVVAVIIVAVIILTNRRRHLFRK